jgi:hypothetical protein
MKKGFWDKKEREKRKPIPLHPLYKEKSRQEKKHLLG